MDSEATTIRDAEPPSASTDELLREVVRRVVEVAQPDRIILFGSRARSVEGQDSDFDLLVVKSGVQNRRHLAQRIYLRLVGVAAAVDIVVVSPEDIARFGDRVGTIIGPAIREGKEIYAA